MKDSLTFILNYIIIILPNSAKVEFGKEVTNETFYSHRINRNATVGVVCDRCFFGFVG